MDQLPNEILTICFNFVDFDTLVNTFARVCRKWSKLVNDLVKFRTLIINEEKDPFVLKLYHSEQIVNYRNELVVRSSRYLRRASLENFCKNVRKLIVFNCDIDFNFFEQVEHLETHCSTAKVIALDKEPKLMTINLKKLRILRLCLELSVRTYYVLDTPSLHSLSIKQIETIELRYPNQLINLESELYHECIKEFKNLRTYLCKRMDIYEGKLLTNLTELEQFQVNCIDKLDLNDLLREKDELKRINLKIIVKGIIISNKEYPAVLLNNDFEIFSSSNQQLFIDNIDCLADKLYFINDFFVDFEISILPESIFKKMSNLKGIVVRQEIEDEINWTALLKCSPLIHTIRISHPLCHYFTQLIARYCPNLSTLSIQKLTRLRNADDLNFVCDFKNLERLSIMGQDVTIEQFRMLINLLNKNKFLKWITFKVKRIDFKVEMLDNQMIYCEYYKCILIEDLDRLIDILSSITSWTDIILPHMKSIHSFDKNQFKGKLFRLCYKLRNFGACDMSLKQVLERPDLT